MVERVACSPLLQCKRSRSPCATTLSLALSVSPRHRHPCCSWDEKTLYQISHLYVNPQTRQPLRRVQISSLHILNPHDHFSPTPGSVVVSLSSYIALLHICIDTYIYSSFARLHPRLHCVPPPNCTVGDRPGKAFRPSYQRAPPPKVFINNGSCCCIPARGSLATPFKSTSPYAHHEYVWPGSLLRPIVENHHHATSLESLPDFPSRSHHANLPEQCDYDFRAISIRGICLRLSCCEPVQHATSLQCQLPRHTVTRCNISWKQRPAIRFASRERDP
jgi:hypothetical protein